MPVDPQIVRGPVSRLKNHHVLCVTEDWSLAVGLWDGDRALLVRWNGDASHPLGNPVSHSHPTWFVLPEEFNDALLALVPEPNRTRGDDWLAGDEATFDADALRPQESATT